MGQRYVLDMSGSGPATKKLEQATHRAKDSMAISRSTGRTVRCPGCQERYDEQGLLPHLESGHRDLYWRLFSEAKDAGLNPFDDSRLLQYIMGRNRKNQGRRRSPQDRRVDA
jgi:hypothetical protein